MRGRSRGTAALAISIALLMPAAGARADGLRVVDIADDAHGLMMPYDEGGLWGFATRTGAEVCTFARILVPNDGDCTGNGVPIPALSRPHADILALGVRTPYVAVPVGEDGIDYRATGLQVIAETAAVPRIPDGEVGFGLYAELAGASCRLYLQASVLATGALTGYVDLRDNAIDSTPCGTLPNRTMLSSEHLELVSAPAGVRVTIPYTLFGPEIQEYLAEGSLFERAWLFSGDSRLLEQPPYVTVTGLDKAPRALGWVVGEDMPMDVGCTRGCPP